MTPNSRHETPVDKMADLYDCDGNIDHQTSSEPLVVPESSKFSSLRAPRDKQEDGFP